MRIGIISDTHGQVARTRQAIRIFEGLQIEAVLHCGDIGSAEVVEQFAAWPAHFVFGNTDVDHDVLAAAIRAAGQTCHGEFGELELEGARIALLHSHDSRRFRNTVDSGSFDVVCYGHTHVAAVEQHGSTLLINPGAIHRANPHSVAVLDLPERTATIAEL